MIGENLDIMNAGWREIIFKDRNQEYGAYQLRRENPQTTNRALLIAISAFVFALALPTIINKINRYIPKVDEKVDVTQVDLTKIKIIEPSHTVTPPRVSAPAQHINNTVTFTPPVVTIDQNVRNQDPPNEAALANADPGQTTIKGDPNGIVSIEEPPGTALNGGATEADESIIFRAVEVSPAFPGGEAAFGKFLQAHIKYPELARQNGISGKVFLQFVVEIDGSLTDIKAVKNPGSGLGEEAIRVLKTSPRWNPGIQNGRHVRVQYTIPVNFAMGEE